MSKMQGVLRVRRGYIHFLLLLGFALLTARLAWIQCVRHRYWLGMAERMEASTVSLQPKRGPILDRHGRGLAISVKAPSICINPRAVPQAERERVADVLATKLKLDRARLLEVLSRPKYFAWVKRKVSEAELDAVLKEHLPGISVREETRRCYPGGTLLCHALGYVGIDDQGLEGLEAAYDSILAGVAGEERVLHDGLGRKIGGAHSVRPARDGDALVLTIDSRVQRIVEEELATACREHKPDAAAAIVLDPWTGDVLAMACWPTFEPARYSEFPKRVLRNFAIVECLEPGSTFKPFVAAAALECGVITPDTRFDCHQAVFRVGARTLHDVHPYGILSVRDIIAYSSNIGMAQVGMKLGPERMYQAVRAFGFGQKTGIELPGESAGMVHHPSRWSKLTITSIPMGQEVAASPLQLTAGFCVFANGGWAVKPRIVLGVANSEGTRMLWRAGPAVFRRVLSARTADLMRKDLLAGVVERGTAQTCAIQGYPMAGKTGTAQLAYDGARGYEPGAYSAAFVGIVPVENPVAVIGVVVKKPKGGSHYGGVVSAPAVARIAERMLSVYRIPRVSPSPTARTLAVEASGFSRGR